ncbi:uncharacterized protein LOC127578520 [Pristis pectinata]|uniref:uncharacterized protein LOC127578520 n=1 Tax=Pristis pectinata TaxID=685728 RepID=UPI00223CC6B4|nr:uncharacterized protein LOC127578520 [Pristis pectinata]
MGGNSTKPQSESSSDGEIDHVTESSDSEQRHFLGPLPWEGYPYAGAIPYRLPSDTDVLEFGSFEHEAASHLPHYCFGSHSPANLGAFQKVFKQPFSVGLSKDDDQVPSTSKPKEDWFEGYSPMECELAAGGSKQNQPGWIGPLFGFPASGPGPSEDTPHVRGSLNKEISSLMQGKDLKSIILELLTQWDDYQLFQLTKFYRERLKQAIEEGVERLSWMLRQEGIFQWTRHEKVAELAGQGKWTDSSTLFLSLVMGKGSQARRVMWESFVKMQHELPKLHKILKEIQEFASVGQEPLPEIQ